MSDNFYDKLSKTLRILRLVNDKEGKELAKELGVDPSFVSQIEHGKRKPSMSLTRKYATIFSISFSTIIELAENIDLSESNWNQTMYVSKKIEG